MAVPKEKVLPVLKEQLKGKGYPKTFIEKAAERYAAKIENEADIDDYITDKVEDLIEADKEADRRATAATTKAKADAAKAITGEEKKDDEIKIDDDPSVPLWAKQLMKQNQELSDKVKGFETKSSADTIATRFKGHEKLKGLPEFAFKGRIPATEEEFEEAVEELANDFKGYVPAGTQQRTDRPIIGGGSNVQQAAGGEAKVPDAIKQFTANLNKSSNN